VFIVPLPSEKNPTGLIETASFRLRKLFLEMANPKTIMKIWEEKRDLREGIESFGTEGEKHVYPDQNGARRVECTINGIGERARNASLEEIVMTLHTRNDLLPFYMGINPAHIYGTCRLASKISGMLVQPNKAIVGANTFAHESGIH
jgi:hypothetical protein